jgi:hypothetical protein
LLLSGGLDVDDFPGEAAGLDLGAGKDGRHTGVAPGPRDAIAGRRCAEERFEKSNEVLRLGGGRGHRGNGCVSHRYNTWWRWTARDYYSDGGGGEGGHGPVTRSWWRQVLHPTGQRQSAAKEKAAQWLGVLHSADWAILW